MPKAPTVYDVAARAQVSIATVSRVLRTPDAVSEATSLRVQAAVRELGYVPSANARGLAARRTNVIGLFLPGHDDLEVEPPVSSIDVPIGTDEPPENENLYFDEVLRGAEVEAWRRGFSLMVAAGRGEHPEELLIDLAGRVDGMAILAGAVPDDVLTQVARRIPVVVLASADTDDGLDHVRANNGPGMRAITEHVLAKNPARVLYVAGPESSPDDAERFAGFLSAMGERRFDLVRGDFTRDGGRSVAVDHDAVICANDQMALGVLDTLERTGRRDVLVTGFDGISAGRHSRPTLTTVHQPMVELGRAAINAVTRRLENPALAPQRHTLPVRVIVRESCP